MEKWDQVAQPIGVKKMRTPAMVVVQKEIAKVDLEARLEKVKREFDQKEIAKVDLEARLVEVKREFDQKEIAKVDLEARLGKVKREFDQKEIAREVL